MRSEKTTSAPFSLKLAAWAGLLFLHLPILLIFVYAFTTEDKSLQSAAAGADARWLYCRLGTAPMSGRRCSFLYGLRRSPHWSRWCLARFARQPLRERSSSGARRSSLLVILPIALPGIVTGIALRSAFNLLISPSASGRSFLGHATFCIVVVYNNAVARFRRTSGSLIEASYDLGADGFQTFRHVILPNIARPFWPAACSPSHFRFDEVIVTTFTAGQQQTLPIWMLEELVRPRQRPGHQCRRDGRRARHLPADPRRLLP